VSEIVCLSFFIVFIFRRHRSCSASDSVYSYTFLRRSVCRLSYLCTLLKPCSNPDPHLNTVATIVLSLNKCTCALSPWPTESWCIKLWIAIPQPRFRISHFHFCQYRFYPFLRATAVPAGTAEARISYGDSVCLSVRPSQPGAEPSPGEIETSGLHHMIA